jgi:hypothetical protein
VCHPVEPNDSGEDIGRDSSVDKAWKKGTMCVAICPIGSKNEAYRYFLRDLHSSQSSNDIPKMPAYLSEENIPRFNIS